MTVLSGPWHGQRHLGAFARGGPDLCVTAMALHAADDGTPYALPISVHFGQFEAGATVAHEDAQLLLLHLRVEGDRRHLRMPGGVDERLPRRGDQRPHPV